MPLTFPTSSGAARIDCGSGSAPNFVRESGQLLVSVRAVAWLCLAGQDGQDAGDVVTELPQVVAQELLGGVVDDLAVPGKGLGREPDVGLGGGHLAGVAKAEHGTQALLRHRRADLAEGCSDDAGGDVVERV